jgi:hypothetical protein
MVGLLLKGYTVNISGPIILPPQINPQDPPIFDAAKNLATRVLSGNNDCSKFLNNSPFLVNGPEVDAGAPTLTAAEALQSDHFTLGNNMDALTGAATTSGASFGLRSVIQVNGSPNGLFLSNLALFGGIIPSGSLAGQTVQILHELAHTLMAIPNDGDFWNRAIDHMSDINTGTIVENCAAAILAAIQGGN